MNGSDKMCSAGILWNMSDKFAREIMINIAIDNPVVQIRTYDLKDNLEQFIYDCYANDKVAIAKGWVDMKIEQLKKCKHAKIVAFIAEIDNPTYNQSAKCIEARAIKARIRTDFSKRMDNYFYDVLIHMSDNEAETKRLIEVFERYSPFIESEFLRKDREPIVLGNRQKSIKNTYTAILKDISDMYHDEEEK